MAGYFACSRGLDFTNYMAKVESEWKRQLDEKISKAISIR